MNKKQITLVEDTIAGSLRRRFATYNPEPAAMPFHARLLGQDRLALYAFIHSLNTNFGVTIFEPVAVALATGRFKRAESQVKSGAMISEPALYEIQKIMDDLSAGRSNPDKRQEVETIRAVCRSGAIREVKPTRVDLYLQSRSDEIWLIDLKTAKPNRGGFKEYKRTLLEWVATTLCANPDASVNTLIAIPYNPYEPKPYDRWTMKGMLDLDYELKVAEEFWDFLGGNGTYADLLDCFERVGIALRDEIDAYFERFRIR